MGSKSRSWEFVVALRSWDERIVLETLLSETTSNYVVEFVVNNETYQVTIDNVASMTSVRDNTDFWDVRLTLMEWTGDEQ